MDNTKELIKCACCGDECDIDDMQETKDGLVCDSCIENYYIICDCCGKLVDEDHIIKVNSSSCDYYVCPDCCTTENNYYTCSCCGDVIDETLLNYDINDNVICDDCLDTYYITCEGCGGYVEDSDACYNEYMDAYYCSDCYTETQGNPLLYDYHDGPRLKPRGFEPQAYDDVLTLGYELELEFLTFEDRDSFIETVKPFVSQGAIKLEIDGSLNEMGLEVISAPFSINIFNEVKPEIENIIYSARLCDAVTSERTGLHIHIRNNDGYSITNDNHSLTGVLMLDYLSYQNEYNNDDFLTLSGRDYLTSYCEINTLAFKHARKCISNYNRSVSDCLHPVDYALDEQILHDWNYNKPQTGGHYTALNFGNGNKQDTYEFRLFGATLNATKFLENISFVVGLYEHAQDLDYEITFHNSYVLRPYIDTLIKQGKKRLEYILRNKEV